jgi:beta-lactamase regulating signal transducer with metallopeptidase domain
MIGFSNTASFAVTHLWQSVLIAAALMGILVFGRRMSGATRYAVAGVALCAAVFGPMAAFLPEASFLRHAMTTLMPLVGADQAAAPKAGHIAGEVRPDGTIVVAARLRALKQDSGARTPQAESVGLADVRSDFAPTISVAPVVNIEAPAVAPKPAFHLPQITLPKIQLPDLTLPFLAVWIIGALAMLARLGLDLAAAERLLASAQPLQLTGDLRRRMGSVRVAVSAQAHGPMAAGIFRPQVILPESALAMLDAPEMAALMEHERAHIERRDIWAALAQRVVLAAFWWSPAMHWVSRRIDEERELACDEAAVARTGDARAFARTLTTHAQSHAWARAPRLAVGAMGPRSQLGRRIRHLIDMAKLGKVPANYSGRLAFAALSLALATAIIVTPRIAAQTPPKAAPAPAKPLAPLAPVEPVSPPSAVNEPAELDGRPRSEARIIVRGDGDLTPEQEAKIRTALDGLDARVVIDRRSRGDANIDGEAFGRQLEAQIEASMANLDFDFDKNGQFSAQMANLGAQISAEVLKNLPSIMDQVQQGLDAAGIKSVDDGHGNKIYKLSPEMKAEIDASMAEAKAEMAKAQAEMKDKFGPEWKAKIKADVDRAVAESRSARDHGTQAWAAAAEASRAGIDSGVRSIEEQLRTRGSQMQPEERRGLERALESMRRMRDRPVRTPVRISVGDPGADLFQAARDCDEDAVAGLVKTKADLNRMTDGAGTALVLAARNGCEGVVAQLLKAGANPNLMSPRFGSALKVAAENGEEDIVAILLKHGANPNLRGPDQDTALVAAIAGCEEDIVKLLVDRGADVNLAYRLRGKLRAPLAVAEEIECEESTAILRARGARLDPKPAN